MKKAQFLKIMIILSMSRASSVMEKAAGQVGPRGLWSLSARASRQLPRTVGVQACRVHASARIPAAQSSPLMGFHWAEDRKCAGQFTEFATLRELFVLKSRYL